MPSAQDMSDTTPSTEEALDILKPDGEQGTTSSETIRQIQTKLDTQGGVAENDIEATEMRISRLRAREGHLLRLDRLFLSRGIHLSLTLPVFALSLQLISRRFARSSPDWWVSSVESSFEFATLTRCSGMLSAVVLIAWVMTLLVVRGLHRTTRSVFEAERDAFVIRGRPFESLHGYEAIHDVTKTAIIRVSGVLSVVLVATLAQVLSTIEGGLSDAGGVLVGLAIGCTFAAFGLDLLRGGIHHNTVERWGLLDAYEPPLHPSCPERVFTEILTTWMDPILKARFDSHVRSLRDGLQPGKNIHDAIEHLLHMRYLEARGELTHRQVRQSMEHWFRIDRIPELFESDWFDEETWSHLFDHIRGQCSPFFRLLERLQYDLDEDLESLRSGTLHFDVDMQNVITDSAHLFAYLHNGGSEPQTFVIKVQTPDFQPHESAFMLSLDAGSALSEIDTHLPKISSVGEDVHGVLAKMMGEGELIWQTLLPQHDGEATVTVRIEDTDGNLLGGRVLAVQVRPPLLDKMRRIVGVSAITAGILSILYRVIPWVATLAAL